MTSDIGLPNVRDASDGDQHDGLLPLLWSDWLVYATHLEARLN